MAPLAVLEVKKTIRVVTCRACLGVAPHCSHIDRHAPGRDLHPWHRAEEALALAEDIAGSPLPGAAAMADAHEPLNLITLALLFRARHGLDAALADAKVRLGAPPSFQDSTPVTGGIRWTAQVGKAGLTVVAGVHVGAAGGVRQVAGGV